MCGIAGFISFSDFLFDYTDVITKMTNTLAHRGPDDSGIFIDTDLKTALGQTRLSIIDLSSAGHQPMLESNFLALSFNGEIYNFMELREKLIARGYTFASKTDTEVILKSYCEWGDECFNKFEGMWAIALLDRKNGKLLLSRDRAGEKPLYIFSMANDIVFGSEVKSLLRHPAVDRIVDDYAVDLFFQLQYIPAPYTIYKHIQQIMPGTIVSISLSTREITTKDYWQLSSRNRQGRAINIDNEVIRYKSLFENSIRKRLIADVPLGVFLSGGIDSSLVTCAACSVNTNKVKTFTIGFPEKKFDESGHAKTIADFLGTQHTAWQLTYKEMEQALDHYFDCYDMPFADESAIPTMLLSKMTRQYVTVALGGDGGDELFGGYNRYQKMLVYQQMCKIPFFLRFGLGSFLQYMPKIHSSRNIARLLLLKDISQVYPYITGVFKHDELKSILKRSSKILFLERKLLNDTSRGMGNKLMSVDFSTYLPDLVLTKVDRASMYHGLEVRAPFLDTSLIEYAMSIDGYYKIGKTEKCYRKNFLRFTEFLHQLLTVLKWALVRH